MSLFSIHHRSLSSWLCILYEPKVLAAAAVQYAIKRTKLDSKSFYRSSWLASMGVSDSEMQSRCGGSR